ncbi:hypothetical protein GB928_004475 [Shinella curvata]|uniref:Uncharacterized protein n=1 Tax=Shinella curvata TaxID=1817964 RepID=A0ABT8X9K1_9HYPH|nr:hypothetical protein [Shinella curvata]MCJ8055172.1 hypothetical protein [Shinella curvata]MDO6120432.1 hypothetical protein [Shinella curvata]
MSSQRLWACLFLLALPTVGQAGEDWSIVPRRNVGPLVAGMTEEALISTLPTGLVRRVPRNLEEGQSTCGTTVFAGTPDEFFVEWRGAPIFDYPDVATVADCAALPPLRDPVFATITRGRWRTADGVGAGITLEKLSEIVGRPITFSMCGCDFGGRVFDGAPDGLSLILDWPAQAEAALGIVPRHEDDYAVTTSDINPAAMAKFTVSAIRVDLLAAP